MPLPGDERRVLGVWLMTRSIITPIPPACAGVDEPSEQFVVAVARAAAEERVEPVVIFDGVQAAGAPGRVERVDVDPIEAHRRDPGEVLRPAVDWTDEGWEQVVDARPAFHYDTPLGGWTSYPFPGCSMTTGIGRSVVSPAITAGEYARPLAGHPYIVRFPSLASQTPAVDARSRAPAIRNTRPVLRLK